jgi:2-aminobenzoate-CoA ligase
VSNPPTGKSAHLDTFVRDHLPPREGWPELIYDLPELRYPPQTNVAAEILDSHVAAGRGENPCLVFDSGSWTYRELHSTSNRIARVLVEDLGLVPGNRVLLRAPNTPMMVASWMAVVKAGGVVVATMPLLRATELTVIAEKARVALALCEGSLSEEMEKSLGSGESLKRVVYFDEVLERAAKKSADFTNVPTAVDDPVLIAFTSGTTGKPKGCVHFHRDLLASADTFFKGTLPCRPDDVFSGSPPMAFTFGLGMHVVFPMRIGASVALVPKPSPEALLESCERHRVTVLSTAPTAYRAMLPLVPKHDVARLRIPVSAGETLPVSTARSWKEATGVPIVDGIGATELFHIFISAAGDEIREGATGKPVLGYQAKLFDDEGNTLPPGTVGRLAVRGPTGCRYLDDERQRDYVRRGWNFTGDAYLMDEDGYFYFQARTDDLIISAGYNISGPEVEEALLAHEAVSDCACVASPDSERGFIVKAFVVPAPNRGADETLRKSLQEFVKARIAPYKYPREVEFVPSLPRTETGKVQRFKLRQLELERKGSR